MSPEPTFLYGLHDAGGESVLLDAQVQGWIVFNEYVGQDPADASGVDFSAWADRGFGVIVKLMHGFNPLGVIPEPAQYERFAVRCARFAQASAGCRLWVIGNEMNYWASRPRANAKAFVPALKDIDEPARVQAVLRALPERFEALHVPFQASPASTRGRPITPDLYAACYRQCRNAILEAQPDASVLVGAVTPWNTQTRYAGNEDGDWIAYLNDILIRLGPHGCDGLALHAFTVDAEPASVTQDAWLDGLFQNRRNGFRAYQDFMHGIPINMRHLPVYIVEADQYQAWTDKNAGWVQKAFAEIHHWNQQPGHQQIHCLALFRWAQSPGNRWQLSERQQVVQDFNQALRHKYQWDPAKMPWVDPSDPTTKRSLAPGLVVETATALNVRTIPGYIGVAETAIVASLPAQHRCLLADGPIRMDSLIWWRVHTTDRKQQQVSGWLPQAGVDGAPNIRLLDGAPNLSEPFTPAPIHYDDALSPGTYFVLLADADLRHAPGRVGKDASDIVRRIPASTPGLILEGPQFVEDAIWWRVRCAYPEGNSTQGWLQEIVDAARKNIQVIAVPGSPQLPHPKFQLGATAYVLRPCLLRRVPGLEARAEDAIVMQLAAGQALTVEKGPKRTDDLLWWQVATPADLLPALKGWVADATTTGYDLLSRTPPELPQQEKQAFQRGDDIYAVAPCALRRTPGRQRKTAYDALDQIPRNTLCQVLGGPVSVEDHLWWQISVIASSQERQWGWTAQNNAEGAPQLARDPLPVQLAPVPRRAPSPRERKNFAVGDRVMNVSPHSVRVRAAPGYVGKPAEDILMRIPRRTVMTIQDGPREADGLRWWLVRLEHPESADPPGWVTEGSQGGIRILAYDFLADHIKVRNPFAGHFPLSQAWGSNPGFYSRFKYNGVPLKGHNGFDFAMPVGTPLLAVDAGRVIQVRFGVGGFGKYVLLEHDWGESVYAHMDQIAVAEGEAVPAQGRLGLSGNTGASTGPHLHLGMRIVPYRRSDGWGGFCNLAPFMDVNEIFRERPVPMPPSPISEESASEPLP